MSAPVDLAVLKDDLGIPAGDTSQDAWLQRQADGIWARMERFCDRKFCVPPAPFVDDWGELTINGAHYNVPPPIAFSLRTTVFLRQIPVPTITAITLNDTIIDTANARWDIKSGKLFSVRGLSVLAEDLSTVLLGARARIAYTAGWDTIPPDLYQALLGAMQPLWASRQGQQSGTGAGYLKQIDVIDVGSVQFASSNAFVEATMKGVRTDDPLLGPWVSLLTDYIDWRSSIGVDCFPTSKAAP